MRLNGREVAATQHAPVLIAGVQAGADDTRTAFEMMTWRGGEYVSQVWSRADLYDAVRRAAGAIARRTRPGDRVVVAPPPGLDFVAMFLGCLGSGRIAVPAQCPATARARDFLDRIVAMTDARLVLTTRDALEADVGDVDLVVPPRDNDAYIQFTSGSTQAPRGAVITHGALAANLAAIGEAWGLTSQDHGVFWLPPFHDMGLVGALLTPVAFGFPATLMHPASFLQRPQRWLDLIAARRATFSGAPNFAYDLCVDRIGDDAHFDLSSWRVAVNGAEPVSAATLRRFAARFGSSGFAPEAFAPGYGLAESVLFVSARRADARACSCADGAVSCGPPAPGVTVRIVEEATVTPLPEGEAGAVWVAGPSLARAYWGAPEATTTTFNARLPGDPRAYLRTGDLGFLRDGEIHITGRAKDVIIRAGRNVHAADIEHAIAQQRRDGGRTAAFACEGAREERLVIVHELAPDADATVARADIIDALGAAFDLVADHILLAPRGAVQVTTSGKTARAATRAAYIAGAIPAFIAPRKDDPCAPALTPS